MRKALLVFVIFSFFGLMQIGFAQVLPNNWTGDTGIDTYQESTTVHGGSYSCRIDVNTSTQSNCDLSNDIAINVSAGSTYTFSFWAYTSTHVRITGVLDWVGASSTYTNTYVGPNTGGWTQFTYSSTVPTGATGVNLRIRCYDTSGFSAPETQYVDDFTFESPTGTSLTVTNGDMESWPSGSALTISNVSREHTVPTALQTCYVQCDITGGTPPYVALIKYSVDGVAQTDIAMSNTGGDTYQGTLPVQANGARVEYYIQVTDAGLDASATSATYGLFWGTSAISNGSGKIKEVDANGVLKYKNYYARVIGVATVASGTFSASNLDVCLQDAFGGINLFKFSASTTTITLGNSYTVVGALDQYNGKTEIIPDDATTDITDNGAGVMPSPAIKTIAQLLASPEDYEGMLIGIQHVSNTGGGGSWPTSGNSANIEITDDGGTSLLTLRVDSDTDLDDNPEPSWPKDVKGIFTQYDSSSPYDGGYQIMPRSTGDILDDGSLPVSLASFTAIAQDGKVTLKWTTESEIDNVGFEIVRSVAQNSGYQTIATYKNNDDLKGQLNSTNHRNYQYTDNLVVNGVTYWYKLVDVDLNGVKTFHGPVSALPHAGSGKIVNTGTIPHSYALEPNYPNPFNPKTTINFDIPELTNGSTFATFFVYNALGQRVKTLYRDNITPGSYTLEWDGANESGATLPSGVYYGVFATGSFTKTIKMVLMK
ncbi:MAG TPA: T9SS type A sorting domain-containing protein [Caldithrix sp.]|nr:T9SS type A sorting domain-containing protein [Caldithrix sp.]